MIERQACTRLKSLSRQFKAIAVTGPRQSGKTTLAKAVFPEKPYATLENPDTRRRALNDPRGFLTDFPQGAILDEIQQTPELFSYLQEILDNTRETGLFILTGSNNFLLQESIRQSLAGRIAMLYLMPFHFGELQQEISVTDVNRWMLHGLYPPVHFQPVDAREWHRNYLTTYVERDVRMIKNITNLTAFERFVRVIASRNAQELNLSAIGIETGLDAKTVQSWIGILESSFIIFLLRPFHSNYKKSIIKRPKLYFVDTGLACALLGIHTEDQLQVHPLRGALFENMVVSDKWKKNLHTGGFTQFYYWREKNSREIDLIEESEDKVKAIEIKAGSTSTSDFWKHLLYWKKLRPDAQMEVIYMGDTAHTIHDVRVVPWTTSSRID
jgi:predicted AAA+ superfamily ATPase